ncbi:MAG TPA: dTDP-4-dehydrorhamnose reductase [Kofleriaceae bacterium]|nr:dTDP-4-dehydrorhamnose reductase [Kofleriaceae bacterium]
MKVLVAGGDGQLGRGLVRRGPAAGVEVVALGRAALDVTDGDSVARALAAHAPAAVIGAAGFTHVDRAELAPRQARAVNERGAELLAIACAARSIPLVYVSTDHVFDGRASRPYREDDPVAPVNTYGATKAAGERAVRAAGGTVARTAWLFGACGPSFVHAIAAQARSQRRLRVVADQHGSPTWVDDLADALLALVRCRPAVDIVHLCGEGPASRHELAVAVVDELRRHGAAACEAVDAVATAELVPCAPRPAYAVLDTGRARALGLPIRPWRDGLRTLVAQELALP